MIKTLDTKERPRAKTAAPDVTGMIASNFKSLMVIINLLGFNDILISKANRILLLALFPIRSHRLGSRSM